jgi:predicted dehydrogenase
MGDGLPGRIGGDALRVGVLGTGFIGRVHAFAVRRAGARLVGVAASTPSSTEVAVDSLGADKGFRADDLVVSPDVDVIHVCTPNHLHLPLAEAALSAGKHVVCEKPLATDETDADRLIAAARAVGSIATVPFAYRFYPMVREVRARIADGRLGPIRLVHGGYLQDWLSTERDDNWRVDADTSGPSRAFADIGSHWCDLVEFVTGDRLTAVCAEFVTALPERVSLGPHAHAFAAGTHEPGRARPVTTEDVAFVLFRTERGLTGSVVVSQISSGHKNQLRFEITGADCTVAFDQEHPDTLWVGRRAGSEVVVRDEAHLHPSAAKYCTVPPGHPQGYQDCFDAFVADTYRAIAAGSTDAVDGLPTFADGARAARITGAVLRSAAAHRWEDIAVRDELKESAS